MVLAKQVTSRDVVASAVSSEDTRVSRIIDIAKASTVAFAAAVAIGSQAPALAANQTLRLPISGNKQIAQVQEVMLETWSVVGDSFFDGSALVRVLSTCRLIATELRQWRRLFSDSFSFGHFSVR